MGAIEVPAEWVAIGFSGLFHVEAAIESATPEVWEARVPCMLPLGSNGAWLALRINRDVDPPTMVLVRKDSAALADVFFEHREVRDVNTSGLL